WAVARMRLSDRYEVVRASTARQACELLTQRGDDFVAILMDIELRGSELNGVQLTSLIRGGDRRDYPDYARALPTLRGTAVIFVTAHGADFSDAEIERAGGDTVIRKPVDFKALSLAITQAHLDRVLAQRR